MNKEITVKINGSTIAVLGSHVLEYGNTLTVSGKIGDEWVDVKFIKEKHESGWTFYGDEEK